MGVKKIKAANPVTGAQGKSGFTLIELSIVLVILGLLAATILSATAQTSRKIRQASLLVKMDVIEQALMSFRQRNNRLPCPSDPTIALAASGFGTELGTAGTCAGGTSGTNYFTDGGNTVVGVIPAAALGLPDDAMFDPWGGRFTYAVDIRMTGFNAFSTYLVNNLAVYGTNAVGSLNIRDASGVVIPTPADASSTHAIALVLSHGPDGHGAFQAAGSASGVRKTTHSDNGNELINCHCDGNAAYSTSTSVNIFVQQAYSSTSDPLNVFDDVLRFYQRGAFNTPADLNGI